MFERNGFKLFSIANIDVSVSVWFIIILAFIGFQVGPIWVLVITTSILIHEFGHAIPSKIWNLSPSVLLHGFGGLCFHREAPTDWKDIAIVLGGPLTQIAAGGLAFAFAFVLPFGTHSYFEEFFGAFAVFSVAWGLFNLLAPIYPLDGGKLFLLFLRRFLSEKSAREWTLYVSIGLAVIMTVAGLGFRFWFIAFLGFFIALDNWNAMQNGTPLIYRKAKVRTSDFVATTMKEAEAAFADEDWREAARLCHLLRSGNDDVPKKMMNRIWEILSVAAVEMGEFEEATGWLKRAPDTARTRAAREVVERELDE